MSRRDRRKQETDRDIRAAARRQLADNGPAGISLRAIARELDMTASAVHYYFASRRVLIDALAVDGFSSLAGALRGAYGQAADLSPTERWLTVCRAHRGWALEHPAEYLLIYGHTGSTARHANPQTQQAMSNALAVLFAAMRDCVASGDVDTERLAAATPASVRTQLASWRAAADGISDLPDGALAACMFTYAQLHGAITLELIGHLPPQLTDHGALFDLQMAHATAAVHRPYPLGKETGQEALRKAFSSSDFMSLENVDGFGDVPGAPGTAAELAQDVPGFELGVRALAGGAQPGMGAVGGLLRRGLAPAPVWDKDVLPAPM